MFFNRYAVLQLKTEDDDEHETLPLGAAQDEQPAEQAPVQQAVPAVKEKQSLLAATAKARKHMPQETAAEKQRRDEEAMMQALTRNTALKSVQELATVGAACRT